MKPVLLIVALSCLSLQVCWSQNRAIGIAAPAPSGAPSHVGIALEALTPTQKARLAETDAV